MLHLSGKHECKIKNKKFLLPIKSPKLDFIENKQGTSLVVQWLRLHASNAGGAGLIPGWETKIPRAMWRGQKIEKVKKLKNK